MGDEVGDVGAGAGLWGATGPSRASPFRSVVAHEESSPGAVSLTGPALSVPQWGTSSHTSAGR
jgi:hypothetical protein